MLLHPRKFREIYYFLPFFTHLHHIYFIDRAKILMTFFYSFTKPTFIVMTSWMPPDGCSGPGHPPHPVCTPLSLSKFYSLPNFRDTPATNPRINTQSILEALIRWFNCHFEDFGQ